MFSDTQLVLNVIFPNQKDLATLSHMGKFFFFFLLLCVFEFPMISFNAIFA